MILWKYVSTDLFIKHLSDVVSLTNQVQINQSDIAVNKYQINFSCVHFSLDEPSVTRNISNNAVNKFILSLQLAYGC